MYGTFTDNGSETITLTGKSSSFHLHLSGTFGSGTVAVGFVGEDGNNKTIADASYTAATDKVINIPLGSKIILTLSGATSPSLYYQVTPRLLS